MNAQELRLYDETRLHSTRKPEISCSLTSSEREEISALHLPAFLAVLPELVALDAQEAYDQTFARTVAAIQAGREDEAIRLGRVMERLVIEHEEIEL